jgi:amidase
VSTFITRLDLPGSGPRLAVKDLIDVEGVPTTAGSRVLADRARPAERDAPCLAGARAADARIVGKANLHELAFGDTGVNPWFGTPTNPLDPALVPGGSSSGSAVAVATGEADVAYGSDTGGSVRIPSACCGTAGLKTTHGRVPLDGVWPLAPGLDTIGPMARDVAGLVLGMQLLEPGFRIADGGGVPGGVDRVGRIRPPAEPSIDAAVDRALAAAGLDVTPVELPGWDDASAAAATWLVGEAWEVDRALADDPRALSPDVADSLAFGRAVTADQLAAARATCASWRSELIAVLERVGLLALPTLPVFPPAIGEERTPGALIVNTIPFNGAGLPAVAVPVPAGGPLPASLQLVGPPDAEDVLLAVAATVEAAVAP